MWFMWIRSWVVGVLVLVLVPLTGCSLNRFNRMDQKFCSAHNPDFSSNGQQCCGKAKVRGSKKRSCSVLRRKKSYCDEMTDEQLWIHQVTSNNRNVDVLWMVQREKGSVQQSYCSVNDGFLVLGRPLIPTTENRIQLRFPDRCTHFGTNSMIGMLEWTGREIKKKYSPKVNLVVADISTPRGGCMWGHSGRMYHASHTNGHDVDIGFLTPLRHKVSPVSLHTRFDVHANWWLIKTLFKNPFTCIQFIFLDERLIQILEKNVSKDPDWKTYRSVIRHAKGHHNHLHVRIGGTPDAPGCPHSIFNNSEENDNQSDENDADLSFV